MYGVEFFLADIIFILAYEILLIDPPSDLALALLITEPRFL